MRTWFVQWPRWDLADEDLSAAAIGCIVRARDEEGALRQARREARRLAERWADQRVAIGVDKERVVDTAFGDVAEAFVLPIKLPLVGVFAAVDHTDVDHPLWSWRQQSWDDLEEDEEGEGEHDLL